jgi:hypothetical protein
LEDETLITASKAIWTAARRLLKQWRVMALLAATYAALLAALYFFVATSEATLWQVVLTLVFAALAPVLFFLLQAMIVNYARGEEGTKILLRRSFRDSCRLALASLPLALLAVVSIYLLNKLQSYFQIHNWPAPAAVRETWPASAQASSPSAAPSLQWSRLLLTTLRFLLLGVVLPLAAASLWNLAISDGLLPARKKIFGTLARAFAPDAMLIYAGGMLLFAFVPYFLLFSRTPAARPGVEFGLLLTRLLLVFIFTLCGWVLTLDALTRAASPPATPDLIAPPMDADTD